MSNEKLSPEGSGSPKADPKADPKATKAKGSDPRNHTDPYWSPLPKPTQAG